MVKSKSKTLAAGKSSMLPLPPVIYINDGISIETPYHAFPFYKLLPKFNYTAVTKTFKKETATKLLDSTKTDSAIALFISTFPVGSNQIKQTSETIKKASIATGRKFLSVNFLAASTLAFTLSTASHHLSYIVPTGQSFEDAAKEVLKWMFSTLAPIETIHLIPDADFRATDTTNFPDYAYSPIAQSRTHPKSAKVQFVAVITAKAVLAPEGNKLTWTVADKTGTANFYFVHRGQNSTYTWDWVLKLQPGQRVALPRMPCVEVKESVGKRLLKAPCRAVGFGLMILPGKALVGVGKGLQVVGEKVSMGKSSRWVAKDDLGEDGRKARKAGHGEVEREWEEKRRIGEVGGRDSEEWSVFNEKGRLAWGSDDEDAKTEKGSVLGVDAEKKGV